MASTQWSIARTPVLSHMCRGVVVLSSGLRMMRRGPTDGCWKECLCLVSSLVAPARGVYSPADREVGMQTIGTVAGRSGSREVGESK